MIKPIDGDYDPPGPGIADTHSYNGWYQWDRLPLGALNKGFWHATKPGWHYGCGEFGAEGLDSADLMRRRCPAHWLTPDPVEGWNPGMIAECQTGRHQPMWFEAPAGGAHAPLEDWVEASQRFQALIVQLMTEAFRRDDRLVTFAIHLFIDARPTGWMKAIMDCERRPKKAFLAYRDALRPLLPTLRMDRWAFATGEAIEAEIHLSNDTHETPAVRVNYQVEGEAASFKVAASRSGSARSPTHRSGCCAGRRPPSAGARLLPCGPAWSPRIPVNASARARGRSRSFRPSPTRKFPSRSGAGWEEKRCPHGPSPPEETRRKTRRPCW
jgi:hypothetical protein